LAVIGWTLLAVLRVLRVLAVLALAVVLRQLRALLAGPRGGLRGIAATTGDFLVHLLGELIDLRPRPAQRIGFAAEHPLCRLLHTLAKLRNALARIAFGLTCFREQALLHKLFTGVQGLIRLLLCGLPQCVI